MAYVPNGRCDVFVSFAHPDDVAIGNSRPWVSCFVADLDQALRLRLGVRQDEGLKVCSSRHLGPQTEVDPQAASLGDVSSAAVFVAVTSPAYGAENSWTMRELAAFQKATGGTGRLLAIEHAPLGSDDKYPEMLRDLRRVPFWQRHPESDTPVTMPIGSEAYLQRLFDIAEQIRKELRKMREEHRAANASILDLARSVLAKPAPVIRLPGEGRTVYLAHATEDPDEEREEVRRYLEQYGTIVLPQRRYPPGGAGFTNAMEADLGRADAFVQLLGVAPAKRPPDLPLGYDRLQFEQAVRRGLPIMQWLRPDIDPASAGDPQHAKLLSGENVLRMGLEGFKAEIMKRIGKPPAPASYDNRQFIFINADRNDLQLAEDLRRELRSADLVAAVPDLRGSSNDARRDLEESIVGCDALVMVYGETTPAWVRGQLLLYSKLKPRRRQPLKALALYVAPPESKPDIRFDLPEITKIDYREGAGGSLSQFLAGQHQ